MKTLAVFLLLSCAALAEDPKTLSDNQINHDTGGPSKVTTVTKGDPSFSGFTKEQICSGGIQCQPEPHLTAEELLPYYKAQSEVDKLMAQPVMVDALAKRDLTVKRLVDKCGEKYQIFMVPVPASKGGDGKTTELDCAVKPPSTPIEKPAEKK